MSDNNNKKPDPGNNDKKSDPDDLSEQYNPRFDINKEPITVLPANMRAHVYEPISHIIANGFNGRIDNSTMEGAQTRPPSWNYHIPQEDDESSATKEGGKDRGKNGG